MKSYPVVILFLIFTITLSSCLHAPSLDGTISSPFPTRSSAQTCKPFNSLPQTIPANHPIPTFTITLSEGNRFTYPQKATPIPEDYYEYRDKTFSPDGRWKVYLKDNLPLSVKSLTDNSVLREDKPFRLGPFYSFESWFPDNSGFVVYDSDEICAGCRFDRLIIYKIDSLKGSISHIIFDPDLLWEDAFSSDISWSPDGSLFAVIVNTKTIYVFDKEGNVLEKIKDPSWINTDIEGVVWTDWGLVYETYKNSDPRSSRIRFIPFFVPKEKHLEDSVLLESTESLGVLSTDPCSPRLMIHRTFPGGESNDGEILIFNLTTRQSEGAVYQFNGANMHYSHLNNKDDSVIAIKTDEIDENLLFFYWNTGELIDQNIHVMELVGWNEALQAFIVVRKDPSNPTIRWLEPIRP